LSDGSIGTRVQGYASPRFCTDRVEDGCNSQGIRQTASNCFELAILIAVRKTPWLFRLLSKDIQEYVSRGWKTTAGCPRRPRSLVRWYARISGEQLSTTAGGSELALLLAMLHKSRISHVGASVSYRSFFDMMLQRRAELLSARFTILVLSLPTDAKVLPRVESVLHVISELLVREKINVVFGFVHIMRKHGTNRNRGNAVTRCLIQ
jgi:hypothetical protein